ncbi:hypothetical protein NKH94_15605 [Mesorhizobium australicum]|uniref:hypothetical protein n=1 Tax=Mesorhizobium australicum TaxID=536018 RepID=UPI003337B60B
MREGDVVQTTLGHKWVVAFLLDAENVEGLHDGRHVFLVRPEPTPYGDDIVYALESENDIFMGWLGTTEIDQGDVYELYGDEQFAVDEQRGQFVKLRREDGSTEWVLRWRLCFNLLVGHDISPEAEWTKASMMGEI